MPPTVRPDLYSAPRRFDLATIFVVTAAFSLMLGSLSALDATPEVKIAISVLAAVVAASQALFLNVANPRGVSIVTGTVACTLMVWIGFAFSPHVNPAVLFVFTIFFGIIGGGVAGYLMGTLVGGVFLVADVLRGKFEGRRPPDNQENEVAPSSENDHE